MLTEKSRVTEIAAAWAKDYLHERTRARVIAQDCDRKELELRITELRVLATDADGGMMDMLDAFDPEDEIGITWEIEDIIDEDRILAWANMARKQNASGLYLEGRFDLVNPEDPYDYESTEVYTLVEVELT